MAAFSVFVTRTFQSKLLKRDKKFNVWVEKVFDQLSVNPFAGKPLGPKWFREKKLENFRVYFLVFEEKKTVYVVNLSTKKDQQRIINSIWLLLGTYKKELEDLLEK